MVPATFALIGGEPGTGKSTLLLQASVGVAKNHPEKDILYVSGEESEAQLGGRARRLGDRNRNRNRNCDHNRPHNCYRNPRER